MRQNCSISRLQVAAGGVDTRMSRGLSIDIPEGRSTTPISVFKTILRVPFSFSGSIYTPVIADINKAAAKRLDSECLLPLNE